MYVILTAQQSGSISGGIVALLCAVGAAIPLLLRLYFKDKKRTQVMEHKRLISETQLKEAEMRERIKLEKAESAQRIKLEKVESAQRIKLEKEKLRVEKEKLKVEKEAIKAVVKSNQESTKVNAMSKKIMQIADLDLFKEKAKRLGCTDDMSLGDMALRVISLAPEVSVKELPEGLSDEEKAVALLAAYRKEEKEVAVEKEDSTPTDNDSNVHESDRVQTAG